MMKQDNLPTSADEDEPLKQAIRAAWGRDAAPQALHHRVRMAMTRTLLEEPEIPQTTRSRQFWDRWPAPLRIAAGVAAILSISLGSAWGIMTYQESPTPRARFVPDHLTPAPTPTLYAMLVSRHDDFSGGAEAQLSPSVDRLLATRNALGAQLHHPLWVPDLHKLGWTFDGVRVFTVNGVSAVSFHFTRGADAISAVSLPVATTDGCVAEAIPDFNELVNNRSFASFGYDGQLHALIGSRNSAPYPQADLRALADRFRNDPACRSGCPTPTP